MGTHPHLMVMLTIMVMLWDGWGMLTFYAGEAKLHMRKILDAAIRGEPVAIRRYNEIAGIVVSEQWYLEAAELTGMAVRAVARGGFTQGDMLDLRNRYHDQAAELRREEIAASRAQMDLPGRMDDQP